MALLVRDVRKWLDGLDDLEPVAIDDDGQALVTVDLDYLEIGRIEDEEE